MTPRNLCTFLCLLALVHGCARSAPRDADRGTHPVLIEPQADSLTADQVSRSLKYRQHWIPGTEFRITLDALLAQSRHMTQDRVLLIRSVPDGAPIRRIPLPRRLQAGERSCVYEHESLLLGAVRAGPQKFEIEVELRACTYDYAKQDCVDGESVWAHRVSFDVVGDAERTGMWRTDGPDVGEGLKSGQLRIGVRHTDYDTSLWIAPSPDLAATFAASIIVLGENGSELFRKSVLIRACEAKGIPWYCPVELSEPVNRPGFWKSTAGLLVIETDPDTAQEDADSPRAWNGRVEIPFRSVEQLSDEK